MSDAVEVVAAAIEPAECNDVPVQTPVLATRHGLSAWLDAALSGHLTRLPAADQLSLAQWQALVGPGQDTHQAAEVAERFGLPLVCLQHLEADPTAVQLLAPNLARRHRALPLLLHRNLLLVAVADPTRADVLNSLDFVTNHRIMLVVAQARDLRAALARTYDRSEDQSIIRELGLRQGSSGVAEDSVHEAERLSREQPIVRLVGEMLADAANRQASDIHLRPQADSLAMLYRIDGLLVPVRRFDRALLPALVGRLKVLGGMNIAERRIPQDGRCSFAVDAQMQVDLRLSVIPTIHGEGVVIRLLDTRFGLRELDGLGLSDRSDRRLRELLCRNQGLFLVTGPTGSGKTTTLYAALNEVRKQPLNILTVEDPVEYHIDGVCQVQVNRAAGLSFARALRNFLRHDPDVVMVGEIRDRETAEIAVESALTGHLVLSTLHTNSAATTVTRLLDLGIPPFLLQSTLLGVFAQRLARQNCPHCRVVENVPDFIREGLGVAAQDPFQRGAGCARCDGMGIRGRAVAGELLVMSPALRALVSADASADAIHRQAVAEGMQSLTAHALEQARAGQIALAEAYRLRTD